MADGLVAFLRERLAEEQAAAEACTPGPWRWGDWRATFGTVEQERNTLEHCPEYETFPAVRRRHHRPSEVLPGLAGSLEVGAVETDGPVLANAEHIVRYDPARVLAEVDAKRRILDRHTPKEKHHNPKQPVCAECGGSEWRADIVDGQEVQQPYPWVMPWPCPTLRLLAAPYDQHPSYRKEWAP